MGDRRIVMKKIFKEYAKIIILEMIEELESNYNKKNKRLWTRKWLLRRDARGVSAGLLKELEIEDQMEYKLFMRMTCEQFNTILENISDTIQRSDTIMRESIPAKIKLQLTLSFLATGNSYRTLQHMFRVSKSSISKIIPEVLDAIHNYLKFYMKVRKNKTFI